MLVFPKNFTATKIPGYVWDVKNRELYSFKVGGVLKKLKIRKPYFKSFYKEYHYCVSHKGKHRVLTLSYLSNLVVEDSEIKFQTQNQENKNGKSKNDRLQRAT